MRWDTLSALIVGALAALAAGALERKRPLGPMRAFECLTRDGRQVTLHATDPRQLVRDFDVAVLA